SVRLRVRVLDPAAGRDLAVLTEALRWREVAVNGEASDLGADEGWYRFSAPEAGVYEITARAALVDCGPQRGRAEWAIPRTVRTLVTVRSPRRWRVTAGERTQPAPAAGAPTRTTLALTPRERLTVAYGPPAARSARRPRFRLSGPITWHLGAGRQRVAARLAVAILAAPAERIVLSIPPAARQVTVTGPDVREVRTTGGRVAVHLRGRVRGRTRLDLRYDLPGVDDGAARFARPDVADGRWADGTLVVTTTATREVVAGAASGLSPLAIAEVPDAARALLSGTPALAYAISSPRYALSADVLNLGKLAMQESIADLGHVRLAYRADGTLLVRASYEIRNRTRQFLTVRLPAGARVLLTKVNDEQRPPARKPAADTPGEQAYLLPLVRSAASVEGLVSFPVEVVYACRAPRRADDRATVPLPRIDLPVAYAWCESYLPRTMRVDKVRGPMRRVERYSSETATARLTYGAAQLAAGYDQADRMQAPTTGDAVAAGPAVKQPGLLGRLFGMGGEAPAPVDTPPTPAPTRPARTGEPDATKQAGRGMLGWNYYRQGRDAYQRGEYDDALEALHKVDELAPDTPAAANARRLISNIDVARGEFKAESREEKRVAAQVRKEAAEAAQRPLARRQREALEQFEQARRAGKTAEALNQAKVVKSLGGKLLARGASKNEQEALLWELENKAAALRDRQMGAYMQAERELEQLERRGRHGEAMQAARRARALAERLDEDEDVAKLNKRMEELAVRTARANAPPETGLTTKADAGSGAVVTDGLPAQPVPKDADKRRVTTKRYDVRGLVRWGGRDAVDNEAGLKDLAETVREATGDEGVRGADEDDTGVRVVGGQLIVTGTEARQHRVRRLLGALCEARGPQVELGKRIAGQKAAGKLPDGEPGGPNRYVFDYKESSSVTTPTRRRADPAPFADDDGDGSGVGTVPGVTGEDASVFLDDVEVDFLERNYKWQAGAEGRLSRRQMAELTRTLGFNRGQKVYVQSSNINVDRVAAARLGTTFRTANGQTFAVVDEAQVRTLRQLARQPAGGAADVPVNPTEQETIVGTDALLANAWSANVAFAGDARNELVVNGNPVTLEHDRILLIDNGGYLTAVKAGAMQHWTEAPDVAPLAEVPAEVHVPAVGQLIKTEKTLVQPSDRLETVLEYTWQGDAK
ncbi:MAG: hypothetical protein KGY99_10405, partial [Phycisphaerae bacterium]|nr:hypothetical protein [Phycisphaerae bacterium]